MRKIFKSTTSKIVPVVLSASILAGGLVGSAYAATQGTIGATSTGAVSISVVLGTLARVTSLDDISFGTWSGTGDLSVADDICVWVSGGGYEVTAEGNGTGNAFELTNGSDTINYTVKWDDVAGSTSGSTMTSGSTLGSQTSSATSTDCDGGSGTMTATVQVDIAEAELGAAGSGAYNGVLTLLIAPE